ncbi:flagellar biosynthesis anti-sigma factor FlgM [Campylobacter hepaticus]|uniref:Flagellar biosynthesis anti-sigma factor FlgM n=1 Tax=Campylobacter hepaticus TaxID=1813019 RepID=A0A424YYK0_9BACT|nr:flagellar biosynthesis anti-sigma factor FlgM [Campylobacter hepaticus]AXP09068.1 flagellar biosynthesis anti-sigma factor FlgM [Campylobacter hepaticus]MCZ0771887.1 flagellar biosynthesis anti-sigma factor FlgM [Campylobacter hepaticus]MCZ0773024.1 flagellar biosynthesis anti-sigma factor FlgM [Campylobacter hepaticus]MCZ0773356.1 flagellar biosynthesis anti-sigma factor FlgM [Campylobacter hepaticus]MCZ0774607.1 flagellar biosynthesis anti-sigma factor FlgM [Campylobacter hepaticus]
MINPIQNGGPTLCPPSKVNKENKMESTQKTDNDKAKKIAEQIKDGTYTINLKGTADAIADALI